MQKKTRSSSSVTVQQECRAVVARLQESFLEMKRLKNEKYSLQRELEEAKANAIMNSKNRKQVDSSSCESLSMQEGSIDLLGHSIDLDRLTHEQGELQRIVHEQEVHLSNQGKELTHLAEKMQRISTKNEQQIANEFQIKKSELKVKEQIAKIKVDCTQTQREVEKDSEVLEALQKEHARLDNETSLQNQAEKILNGESESELKTLHYELQQTSTHLQELLLKNKILNEQIQGILAQEQATMNQITAIYPQITEIDERLLKNISTLDSATVAASSSPSDDSQQQKQEINQLQLNSHLAEEGHLRNMSIVS